MMQAIKWLKRAALMVVALYAGILSPASAHHRASYLEIDKMRDVELPPMVVTHQGAQYSLRSIFSNAGIDLDVKYDEKALPGPEAHSDGELHSMMVTHRNPAFGEQGGKWSAWCAVVKRHRPKGNLIGSMFDVNGRQGCAIFFETGGFKNTPKAFFRTVAHEAGHVFNLDHPDAENSSIMTQTVDINPPPDHRDTRMRLEFSARSKNHLHNGAEPYVRPGGSAFGEGR